VIHRYFWQKVPNPNEFGVAEIKDNRVVGLEEKPKKPKSDYALVGVYMFTSSIFKAVGKIKPSWRNELEITDAIQYLIDEGYVVNSHIVDGWWKDTGKLEDILDANRMILAEIAGNMQSVPLEGSEVHGNVALDEDVIIKRSTLRGPCTIGRGAVVTDSYIGPFTSIGPNSSITGSEIENSIILADCVINNIGGRLESSLVGKNVRISKSAKPPRAYKLMVGDNSDIILF